LFRLLVFGRPKKPCRPVAHHEAAGLGELVGQRLDGDHALAAAGLLALEPCVRLRGIPGGQIGGLDVRPGEIPVAAFAVPLPLFLAVAGVDRADGAAFVERLRRKVPSSAKNDTNARAWRRLLPFGEVVRAVEAVKGEEWASFADRKGDRGRDLALYVARMNCGLSIPELAAFAGIEPAAASKALQRMRKRLRGDRKLKSILRKVSAEIGVREQ